jgi:hypothetical protein
VEEKGKKQKIKDSGVHERNYDETYIAFIQDEWRATRYIMQYHQKEERLGECRLRI